MRLAIQTLEYIIDVTVRVRFGRLVGVVPPHSIDNILVGDRRTKFELDRCDECARWLLLEF